MSTAITRDRLGFAHATHVLLIGPLLPTEHTQAEDFRRDAEAAGYAVNTYTYLTGHYLQAIKTEPARGLTKLSQIVPTVLADVEVRINQKLA